MSETIIGENTHGETEDCDIVTLEADLKPTHQELKELATLSKRTDTLGAVAFQNRYAAFRMRYQLTGREMQEAIDAGRILLAAEAGQS